MSELDMGYFFVTQPDPTQDFPDLTQPNPEHVSGFLTRADPTQ